METEEGIDSTGNCLRTVSSKQWKKNKFCHFLVVVQLIHRLTQADISCPTTVRLFFFSLLVQQSPSGVNPRVARSFHSGQINPRTISSSPPSEWRFFASLPSIIDCSVIALVDICPSFPTSLHASRICGQVGFSRSV